MATDNEETLQQRYLREHDEYVARIESMTTAQIMAMDVRLEDMTAQRDQLLAALEAVRNAGDWYTSAIELNMDIDGNELLAVVDKAIAAVKGA